MLNLSAKLQNTCSAADSFSFVRTDQRLAEPGVCFERVITFLVYFGVCGQKAVVVGNFQIVQRFEQLTCLLECKCSLGFVIAYSLRNFWHLHGFCECVRSVFLNLGDLCDVVKTGHVEAEARQSSRNARIQKQAKLILLPGRAYWHHYCANRRLDELSCAESGHH